MRALNALTLLVVLLVALCLCIPATAPASPPAASGCGCPACHCGGQCGCDGGPCECPWCDIPPALHRQCCEP
jgi:hypothetical protein